MKMNLIQTEPFVSEEKLGVWPRTPLWWGDMEANGLLLLMMEHSQQVFGRSNNLVYWHVLVLKLEQAIFNYAYKQSETSGGGFRASTYHHSSHL